MSHKTLVGGSQGKFWGQTQCLFVNDTCEVHYIEAVAGGFCSKHYHANKWNRFVVLEGVLEVTIYKEKGEDVTVIKAGQFTDVPPKDWHRFRCLEDCKCLEIYWVDGLDVCDIIREDKGGVENKT